MDSKLLLQEFKEGNYHSIVLATTANHSKNFLRLPDKVINQKNCMSFSIADEKIAEEMVQVFDAVAHIIYVDVERKQKIDLPQIVAANIKKAKLREIKPNDLAMEAVDVLVYKMVKDKTKNILIVGTGNIAIKLAVRLAERNFNIFLHGRNSDKVELYVKAVNGMLPRYTPRIRQWQHEKVDVLCTLVSATEVIDEAYIPYLNPGALAIDGGIGNFSKSFIRQAHLHSFNILRLDVRISNDILSGIDQSFDSDFFTAVKGEQQIGDITIVAGGLIGKEGDIIVDRIQQPRRVIGVANGIGGVKSQQELTMKEQQQINEIKENMIGDSHDKKSI